MHKLVDALHGDEGNEILTPAECVMVKSELKTLKTCLSTTNEYMRTVGIKNMSRQTLQQSLEKMGQCISTMLNALSQQ
jgi:hypothetical protein